MQNVLILFLSLSCVYCKFVLHFTNLFFQVLMMVLPLLLVMVLPRMMNDPETRKVCDKMSELINFFLLL